MSTAQQVIALLKSHIEGEEQQFYTVAMQVAAHEAKQGHSRVAQEIRDLIDRAKQSRSPNIGTKSGPTPLIQPKGELATLLSARYSTMRLSDMVLDANLCRRLERVIHENINRRRLEEHNLSPRRKLLLVGPPGSGKSMTAEVLAGELQLPLFTVLYDTLITKFMGETASQLRLIFDAMSATRGVYFFDEFDAIGAQRSNVNDVGEIRRVLNSCLQFLENDQSPSLIIAATNHPELLDKALFRRFDDVIQYELPTPSVIQQLIQTRISNFKASWSDWQPIVGGAEGLSQAEIIRAIEDTVKATVLEEKKVILEQLLIDSLIERKNATFR
ncbi:AAA ATPase central domain-containing protein (plasmid) [Leptolyngbya boryana NIES-2135]|jgi:AAA+ superfamily predicted ATPase|uniref:AAA ATPase central domain-containing protein n=1 Tax=Leptolyngbya boryana NIES-2135 TaxID=1973484 RepID=A0A1Z4JRF4_LEPBY|nr:MULTISPECIES: ATP-binding protein [Leptolyngbya]BAY59299.1 AAA ATPase central domain-containing protein [Leptolyngbya boryana NIES-2135]MBD2372888.1 ATP-binding protein [Leptolyngbya sp. FACHB-238]MBD2397359.1 ATP-binding protein [Leptolyngbya sp. FACHB-239]MBD2403836.1 ATP-binding protein [Leptolyngbya sp. FACHB-402]ULP33490.1 ATP-binding protein [Leptolyngbya boryana IU 594]